MAGIFSRLLFNNAIFNTDEEGGQGAAGGFDFSYYRKNLEELSRISSESHKRKYKRKVKKVIKLAQAAPIEIKEEIKRIELDFSSLDFSAIEARIEKLVEIIAMIAERDRRIALEKEIEEESELMLLLVL